MTAMLRGIVDVIVDVIVRRTRQRDSTSHVGHKKRVAWFTISMHACGSVPIVSVLRY